MFKSFFKAITWQGVVAGAVGMVVVGKLVSR